MKFRIKSILLITSLIIASSVIQISAQEALKSQEEEYFTFLSLFGVTSRNYLNYRTLSDSVWTVNDEADIEVDGDNDYLAETINPWANKITGTNFTVFENDFEFENKFLNFALKGIDQKISVRAYGPEWFNSINSDAPFGVNDGSLWQGRGYNTSMSAGARIEGYGFEFTIKPQLSFSENLKFDIMSSKRGNGFGHYYQNCDAPQRFGDSSFWTKDWGDSEIRWSWYGFTVGFGTMSVWLGPNYLYPLLLSNNAATFPKFDIGLRRTKITIPKLDWYAGDIEGRMIIGKLTESDYFDTDTTNDHRRYILFSLSYAPSFLPGLTLGANKVTMARWDDETWFSYLDPRYASNKYKSKNDEDQKASITLDWLFEKVNTEFYAEVGIDDYLPEGLDPYAYIRFPFHTMSYTVGVQQGITVSKKHNLYGKINFEWNNTEPSQDYQMWGTYNFGCHSHIIQGYTNKGQWLGSGIGYGGNSQHFSFTLYSNHGFDRFFIARNNPDNAYVFGKCTYENPGVLAGRWFAAFKANFYTGYETLWYLDNGLSIDVGFTYNLIINPLYNPGYTGKGTINGGQVVDAYREHVYWNNFNVKFGFKWAI